MKTLHKLFLCFFVLSVISCEDIIEKKDLTAVDSDDIWASSEYATLYLNTLYDGALPGFSMLSNISLSDETRGAGSGQMMYGFLNESVAYGTYGVAAYSDIREINILLQDIDFGSIEKSDKDIIKGQAYFLRAWEYWDLVKYYGGVPLVLYPQDPNEGTALQIPRNKTSECIDQIVTDLDSAINMVPARYAESEYGRITKSAAAAFKARVLLFYASPQFNPDNLTERWDAAYQASVDARDFALANGHALHPDFERVFLDEINDEVIMTTIYNETAKYHAYENTVRPASVSNSGSTGGNPNWDIVKSFPMKDGRSIEESSDYNVDVFWKDRDPRFYATIGYNSQEWIFPDRETTRQWTYQGNNIEAGNNTATGFYLKKAVDNTIDKLSTIYTGTDWIEIRYAEVLLNLAEAANEVGNQDEAYDILYQIRSRAGIEEGDGSYGLATNMNKDDLRNAILNERKIELAFENKRHWDMRRRNLFIADSYGVEGNGMNGTVRTVIETTVDTDYIISLIDSISDATVAFQVFESSIRDTVNWDNPYNYDLYFNTEVDLPAEVIAIDFKQPLYNFYFIPQSSLDKNPNLLNTEGWLNGDPSFDPYE